MENILNNEYSEDSSMDKFQQCIKNQYIYLSDFNRHKWNDITKSIDFQSDINILKSPDTLDLDFGFKFGDVNGSFEVTAFDTIHYLKNGPSKTGDFIIKMHSLKKLEGSPWMVDNFDIGFNLINKLNGCPDYIRLDFNVGGNLLLDLDNGPLFIGGNIFTDGNKKINKETNKLFIQMHRDIKKIYRKNYINSIIFDIKKDVANKEYASKIMFYNPDYSIFLGRFKEEIEKLKYLKKIKDFGLF